ncbi:short-chain fatty acyl-CoA regulator family protein [Ostreiculturibacter nitratireducens]|uniref:short-chain fatty acyl-CoA regulator family protein n=1 Tax=Ostreiculturibacter nitratireducens TaxID=3075226 RepID=UPI0031B60E13
MRRSALAGTRIRERRTALGLKQADLARSVGISPAYLNLIEHNRRRVGEELTTKLADTLGVEVTALAEGAESALFEGLREAAAGVGAAETAPEVDRIEEFVGRFPGWAGLLAQRQSRLAALERTVEALSERMAHDPHLSASLHEVLSAAASVRSTAAILAEIEDIDPDWRKRFHGNLQDDSERLAEAAEALVAYLDTASEGEAGISSPQEEVEAWLAASRWHLAAVERAQMPEPEDLIAGAPELASTAARKLAADYIARAREDALALPLEPFVAAVAELGVDPGLLAGRFGVGLPTVFRRLATLPEDAVTGPVPGLVTCDASGTLTFRRPVAGFALPRFGAACPLWPLYRALSHPTSRIRERVTLAGRVQERFLTFAYAEPNHPEGFGGPEIVTAFMLILPEAGSIGEDDLAVGPSCRVCPRTKCPARREPSFIA